MDSLFASLSDKLCHLRIYAHGLDEYDLASVQVHPVGPVQLFASFDKDVRNLLALGICFAEDVEDIS